MKTITAVLIAAFLLVGAAFAAGIDGKYVSERKMDRNGETVTITQTFDLKTDGAKLTGTVSMSFGSQEPRTSDIKDGKVDGNKFSFSVVMSTPNGEMKTVYEGTLEGDTLKGTSAREGGQPRPFEAKKK